MWWVVYLALVILVIGLIFILNSEYKNLVIVTAHYKEDLNWLKKSPWPVVVCDKKGAAPMDFQADPKCSLSENRGREASAFLKYIIEYYDSLPEYVAFIHGHENAWHQEGDLINAIRRARITHAKYISLNNRIDLKSIEPQAIEHSEDIEANHPAYKILKKRWSDLFGPILGIPYPEYLRFKCCAQFIVSKDTIRNHSKEDYQKLYEFVMDPKEEDYTTGMAMEFIWHIIFGGNPDMCSNADHGCDGFSYDMNFFNKIL